MRKTYLLSTETGSTLEEVAVEMAKLFPSTPQSQRVHKIYDPSELCDAKTGEPVKWRYNFLTGYMENLD